MPDHYKAVKADQLPVHSFQKHPFSITSENKEACKKENFRLTEKDNMLEKLKAVTNEKDPKWDDWFYQGTIAFSL